MFWNNSSPNVYTTAVGENRRPNVPGSTERDNWSIPLPVPLEDLVTGPLPAPIPLVDAGS